jgi:hypothetical protein
MDLTDSFTWEDLHIIDAGTGKWSAAKWIPRINKFSTRIAIACTLFHFIQSIIRIVSNHETMFIVWYPFDWTVSPYYELVNISQVTMSLHQGKPNFFILIYYFYITNRSRFSLIFHHFLNFQRIE